MFASGGGLQGVGQDLGALVAADLGHVVEGLGQGQELTQGVPAKVVLLEELAHVLGGRAPGAGLIEAAAVHQRHHREHLGARA